MHNPNGETVEITLGAVVPKVVILGIADTGCSRSRHVYY